jgi:hypothetical protein
MRITFIPQTRLGKWSVGLIAGLFLSLMSLPVLMGSGQRGGDEFFSNPVLAAPLLLAGICGVSAFLTGIVGIIKRKERSIFVFLAVAIGFFALYFALGQIVSS